MIRRLSQFVSVPFFDEHSRSNPTIKNQEVEKSPVQPDFSQSSVKMLAFEGLRKRAQLEALLVPRTNLVNVPKATAGNTAFLSATSRIKNSRIDDETNRILENYDRQIRLCHTK